MAMNRKYNKKCDFDFYERLWRAVIKPQIQSRLKQTDASGYYSCQLGKSFDDIWMMYSAFNEHCSKNYMLDPDAHLDRHKIAACYTYAIVAVQPIEINKAAPLTQGVNLVNEQLAITVGCSILCSFTKATVLKSSIAKDEQRLAKALERIKGGVVFPHPSEVSHGVYELDVARYLAFTHVEKNYNILLLSLLFYEWEKTLLSETDYLEMVKAKIEANSGENTV